MNKIKTKNIISLAVLMLGLTACSGNGTTSTSSSNSSSSSSSNSSIISSSSSSSSIVVEASDIFASPTYDMDADGTREKPYGIYQAVTMLKPGKTLYLLDGTYKLTETLTINDTDNKFPATSKEEMKTMKPVNEGAVKFDFSSQIWNTSNRGIKLDASYWHLYGIEEFGAGDNGILVTGNYNIVENCVTHDNGDTGIQLGRFISSYVNMENWPSNNLILNCTSYDNHDPKGEDSDGFACKLTTGIGNVFDGCIAYNNVDDGWDLYSKGDSGPIGPVTLRNCVSFNNGVTSYGVGTSNSDGNGFKLGGESIAVPHIVENCIAFNNLAAGFTDNSNPGTISLINCTSYNNGIRDADSNNFDLCRDTATSINYMKNLFSYCDYGIDFRTGIGANRNSKDQYKGTVENSIFYYGRGMYKFDGVEECDYSKTATRGTNYTSTITPFVFTTIPQVYHLTDTTEVVDIHDSFRDDSGNVALGDFLKIKAEFVSAAFEGNISIGADLVGGNK